MQRYWNGTAWTDHRVAPAPGSPGLSRNQKWLLLGLVIAGIITFAVVGVMTNNVAKENAGDGHVPGTGSGYIAADTPVGTGVPVRDGKFEFIVRGFADARGYVTVIMKVTNIGNEAQTFFPQNQKLIDASGRTFEADTMAVYDFNKEGIIELNPGLGVEVAVPFKAPPGTQFRCRRVTRLGILRRRTGQLGLVPAGN
jgi:Domain of unknown function (DUF4352)/Protein of unknown function (DUF2510)